MSVKPYGVNWAGKRGKIYVLPREVLRICESKVGKGLPQEVSRGHSRYGNELTGRAKMLTEMVSQVSKGWTIR